MGDRADGKNKDLIVNDANVRLAISLLIDEDTIAEYVGGGACKVMGNPQNKYTTHDYDTKNKSLDLVKAKQLLDAAGWDYTTEVEILCYYIDQVSLDVLEIIKADAAKIGFKIKINVVTENAADAIYTDKNWDLMFYQSGGSDTNPVSGAMGSLKSGSAWVWNMKAPWIGEKYDALIADFDEQVSDSPEYIAAIHKMQKSIYDDAIIIPIYVNAVISH